MLTLPEGRRSEPNSLFIVAQTTDSRTHVTVIRAAFGHELTAVSVVSIPRLLASVQRTRVSVSLFLQVEDGVDRIRGVAITDSNHDRILIGTHDVGDAVEHSIFFFFCGLVGLGISPIR